jgi:hypothetical protein
MVFVAAHPGSVLDGSPHPACGPQPVGSAARPPGPHLSALDVAHWVRVSRGRHLVHWDRRNPHTPDCSSSRAQRLTDCRCMPNSRATCDWLSPGEVIAPPPTAVLPMLRNPAYARWITHGPYNNRNVVLHHGAIDLSWEKDDSKLQFLSTERPSAIRSCVIQRAWISATSCVTFTSSSLGLPSS